MKKKVSRLESNREVRRILARHSAALEYCTYSCTGSEVRFTGVLVKNTGHQFNVQQIENIIQDILRNLSGHTIRGELDNWNFSAEHITWLGSKSSKAARNIDYEDEDAS
jgi:hypothetical protein